MPYELVSFNPIFWNQICLFTVFSSASRLLKTANTLAANYQAFGHFKLSFDSCGQTKMRNMSPGLVGFNESHDKK